MNKNLLKALAIAVQARIPVLIWGDPGVGKSSSVSALAMKLGMFIQVVIASLREPSDFAGLPILDSGKVRMAPPAWAQDLCENGGGMLFLDEITTCPPAVQAALLRVVLDGVVGELKLPANLSIVAAANPPEVAAGGWDLSPPMANRFVHIKWNLDARMWAEGLVKNWDLTNLEITLLPSDWETELIVAQELISQFINKLPNLLFVFPKEEAKAGQAWPSPRSWTAATRLLAACRAANAGDDVTRILISGAIGEGPAISFLNWLSELDLPDPEQLLIFGNYDFKVHKGRHDKVGAILNSLLVAVKRVNTIDRYYAALKLICCAGQQGFKDIAFPIVRQLEKLCPQGGVNVIPEMSVFASLMAIS